MIPCKRSPCLLGKLFVATLILSPPGYTRSLHDVVEQVWTQQPEAMSRTLRTGELSARQDASESWTPAPPSMSLAHQTDEYCLLSRLQEAEQLYGDLIRDWMA